MSVKPQFDTYRYVGEVCRLHGQSIVECRLPGSEISSILAIHAQAIPNDCVCADGEAQYSGKVLLTVVYEDGDRKICRAERGAEFFHKAEGSAVTPACQAKATFTAENVTWRREGSGLYVSVIVDADVRVYGGKQMEYLSGGEGLIVKKETQKVYKTVCVTGETEGEDEFDSDYASDILLHSETAVVHHVGVGAGQLDVEGELILNICALKSDESVCSYERLIPFHMQIPCDEAFGHVTAGGKVRIKSAHITADTDEEKGKSKLLFTYCLSAECQVCIKDEIPVVVDAFSTEAEITLKSKKDGGRYLLNQTKWSERISGIAALSPLPEGEFSLQAAALPRAELTCRKGERGMEAEGAILAEVLLCGEDGAHRSASLSLPFVFPVEIEGDYAEAECIVCGLNVRRKKSGETEAEATLKLCIHAYEDREWAYVCEANEGEVRAEEDSAFSVFIPKADEDLWGLAKRLGCSPEELQKSNPDLTFPLCEGQRIYVYRQIK